MPKWISDSRKDLLSDLAAEVVAEFCPDLPVQPERIIQGNRLTVSFGEYGNAFDGLLEYEKGRFHIYCNIQCLGGKDSPRARFTLCHELGHYYIDEHRSALAAGRCPAHPSKTEYSSRNLVEQEADFFAGRVLMPTQLFYDRANRVPRGLAGIRLLSSEFQTSLSSTAIRYVELDLVPCAVIKWGHDGIGWKWLSTSTFRLRYRKTIERVEDLQPDCATARALRGEEEPPSGFFQNGSTASFWFRRVDDSSYRNSIMVEQAVSLGRYGALTFLYPEAGTF